MTEIGVVFIKWRVSTKKKCWYHFNFSYITLAKDIVKNSRTCTLKTGLGPWSHLWDYNYPFLFAFWMKNNSLRFLNPRPVGVWRVTHSVGGGGCGGWGGRTVPPVISQTTGPISKIQTPFDSQFYVNFPNMVWNLTRYHWWRQWSGQSQNVSTFRALVTSASKISMLSTNKVNESAWILSLTFVSIISYALWQWYRSRSSQVTRLKDR